jgi:hypothetical protein
MFLSHVPLRQKAQRLNPIHSLALGLDLAMLLILVFVSPSISQAASFRPRVGAIRAALLIDGRTAIVVPGPEGAERANSAASALSRSGTRSVRAARVTRRRWVIVTSSGEIVLSVTRSDSWFERASIVSLAYSWASRINGCLSLPAIVMASMQQPVIIPTGESRSFVVGGAALPRQISVGADAAAIASAEYDPTTRTITMRGESPGTASIEITATDGHGGEAVKPVTLFVENSAGTINGEASATVTGTPFAPVDVIVQAIRTALCRAVTLEPTGYLEVISQPYVPNDLEFGQDATYEATVRAVGSDLIPAEQTVEVHVHNDSASILHSAESLYYSNNPETVKHPQTLFSALLPASSQPIRLVYHHQNSTSAGLVIRVEVINVSSYAATVHIIRGMSPAIPDPVVAGTRAGTDFLRDWRQNIGEEIDIPARSRLELVVAKTQPNDVVSGVVEIAETSGDTNSLLLRVAAEPIDASLSDGLSGIDTAVDPETAGLPSLPLSDDFLAGVSIETKSDQIYAAPSVASSGTYTVGSMWLRINIGTKDAVARAIGNGSNLSGNYGVIYTINLSLTNPTTVPRPVAITFESEAGAVSGIFDIGNDLVASVNNLYPPNEQELTRTTLAPGATQTLQIQTIPLSGSAYPASIVAHAL